MHTSPIENLHVILPAGGAGTRLWPLSRAGHPKFLLDLTGSGRTLIQLAWDRTMEVCPPGRVHVVTGTAHAQTVQEQLPRLREIFIEPSPRDSMPAIGLAAAVIAQRDPDAVVSSFAADQFVDDVAAFGAAVRRAVAVAEAGYVCTIGVTPTSPSTAFGYIEAGGALEIAGAADALHVSRFVEKPDTETAQQYVDAGNFSWNAGMFVAKASVLLDHLARLQPGLHGGLRAIAEAWDTEERNKVFTDIWPTLTKIAIDHAIAEPISIEGGLAVIPASFGWNDIGDFASAHAANTNISLIDAEGVVFGDTDQHVAIVGMDDVVVVRTADAILVTTRANAQRVREVTARLRETGREELL